MVNPSRTHGAISLHVYIPPYTKCSIFNLAEGSCNVVDMTASNAYSDKPLTPMLLSDQKPIVSVSELLEKLRSVFGASEDALCLSGSRNSAIQDTLDRVQFVADEWRDLVHFSDHNYTRMLLTLNEHFSLMLNCWKPQQACPLHSHDHSPENTMFVKSIAGALEIRRFADEAGTQKLSEVVIESDSPCLAVANSDLGLHTTRNPSTTCVALTLHLYTPPMVECIHAGGIAPVVYSKAATDLSVGAPSPTKDRAMGSISAAPQASLFSNFQALVEMLSNVFDKYPDQSADLLAPKIKSILHKFEANPKEVRDYYGPHVDGTPLVRCRIGLHAKFEVYVVFWKAGYVSPIHSHGQSSEFIKVIDGEMTDTHFSTPERGLPPYVVSANVLKSCGTTFLSSKTVHQTRVPNMDSSALLVYSPPYVESVTFASDTGAATRVSVSNSDCFSCCTKE
jgi:predicted metal-dependent enzyme (double-stranded beta helix superfamily)